MEQAQDSPRPVRFTWRGNVHAIVDVLSQHVDIGYGDMPSASRHGYTRRHRRCYQVRDEHGEVFDIYLDYGNRQHKSWWLTRRIVPAISR